MNKWYKLLVGCLLLFFIYICLPPIIRKNPYARESQLLQAFITYEQAATNLNLWNKTQNLPYVLKTYPINKNTLRLDFLLANEKLNYVLDKVRKKYIYTGELIDEIIEWKKTFAQNLISNDYALYWQPKLLKFQLILIKQLALNQSKAMHYGNLLIDSYKKKLRNADKDKLCELIFNSQNSIKDIAKKIAAMDLSGKYCFRKLRTLQKNNEK